MFESMHIYTIYNNYNSIYTIYKECRYIRIYGSCDSHIQKSNPRPEA